jgi:hypothetical protein
MAILPEIKNLKVSLYKIILSDRPKYFRFNAHTNELISGPAAPQKALKVLFQVALCCFCYA